MKDPHSEVSVYYVLICGLIGHSTQEFLSVKIFISKKQSQLYQRQTFYNVYVKCANFCVCRDCQD